MNRAEYILSIVGEEGNEVAHRVCKAVRFGVYEVQPGQPDDNGSRIRDEVYDLIGAYIFAADEAGLPPLHLDPDIIASIAANKRAKIEKFMAISREQGVLS
jgi:hypothetical protein